MDRVTVHLLACSTVQAYLGWAKACSCLYCCSRHLWFYDRRLERVEIVTLRVGARAKERKGGRGGEKINTPAWYHCPFGKLCTLANRTPDWCSIGEVDWWLSINCKSILFILFSSVRNCGKSYSEFRNGRRNWNFNSAVEASLLELERLRNYVTCITQWESQSNFYTGIRTRFAHSAKTYTTFTSCQNAACSNTFFFCWQVDCALEGSPFWLSKCDFSHLFHTERSWHTYWFSVVFEFLVSKICPMMQEHFLRPLLKRKALYCG